MFLLLIMNQYFRTRSISATFNRKRYRAVLKGSSNSWGEEPTDDLSFRHPITNQLAFNGLTVCHLANLKITGRPLSTSQAGDVPDNRHNHLITLPGLQFGLYPPSHGLSAVEFAGQYCQLLVTCFFYILHDPKGE